MRNGFARGVGEGGDERDNDLVDQKSNWWKVLKGKKEPIGIIFTGISFHSAG